MNLYIVKIHYLWKIFYFERYEYRIYKIGI